MSTAAAGPRNNAALITIAPVLVADLLAESENSWDGACHGDVGSPARNRRRSGPAFGLRRDCDPAASGHSQLSGPRGEISTTVRVAAQACGLADR